MIGTEIRRLHWTVPVPRRFAADAPTASGGDLIHSDKAWRAPYDATSYCMVNSTPALHGSFQNIR